MTQMKMSCTIEEIGKFKNKGIERHKERCLSQ